MRKDRKSTAATIAIATATATATTSLRLDVLLSPHYTDECIQRHSIFALRPTRTQQSRGSIIVVDVEEAGGGGDVGGGSVELLQAENNDLTLEDLLTVRSNSKKSQVRFSSGSFTATASAFDMFLAEADKAVMFSSRFILPSRTSLRNSSLFAKPSNTINTDNINFNQNPKMSFAVCEPEDANNNNVSASGIFGRLKLWQSSKKLDSNVPENIRPATAINPIEYSVVKIQTAVRCMISRQNVSNQLQAVVFLQAVFNASRIRHAFKAFRALRRRQLTMQRHVLDEIQETETAYISSLNLLKELFIDPLRNNPPVIPPDDFNRIFSNLDIFLELHLMMFPKTGLSNVRWKCCDVVASLNPNLLKFYTSYLNMYEDSLHHLGVCEKRYAKFRHFISTQSCDVRLKGLQLRDMIIKPLQRITKYPLLLQELVRNLDPVIDHADHSSVSRLTNQLKQATWNMNEKRRESENRKKVVDIQQALGGSFKDLVQPHRTFVFETPNTTKILDPDGMLQNGRVILFNDMAIVLWGVSIIRMPLHILSRATTSSSINRKKANVTMSSSLHSVSTEYSNMAWSHVKKAPSISFHSQTSSPPSSGIVHTAPPSRVISSGSIGDLPQQTKSTDSRKSNESSSSTSSNPNNPDSRVHSGTSTRLKSTSLSQATPRLAASSRTIGYFQNVMSQLSNSRKSSVADSENDSFASIHVVELYVCDVAVRVCFDTSRDKTDLTHHLLSLGCVEEFTPINPDSNDSRTSPAPQIENVRATTTTTSTTQSNNSELLKQVCIVFVGYANSSKSTLLYTLRRYAKLQEEFPPLSADDIQAIWDEKFQDDSAVGNETPKFEHSPNVPPVGHLRTPSSGTSLAPLTPNTSRIRTISAVSRTTPLTPETFFNALGHASVDTDLPEFSPPTPVPNNNNNNNNPDNSNSRNSRNFHQNQTLQLPSSRRVNNQQESEYSGRGRQVSIVEVCRSEGRAGGQDRERVYQSGGVMDMAVWTGSSLLRLKVVDTLEEEGENRLLTGINRRSWIEGHAIVLCVDLDGNPERSCKRIRHWFNETIRLFGESSDRSIFVCIGTFSKSSAASELTKIVQCCAELEISILPCDSKNPHSVRSTVLRVIESIPSAFL